MLELDNKLPDFQMGFVKGRNNIPAAWMLKNICSKRPKDRNKTFFCFVDFSKAFSYADRVRLFDKMAKKGTPGSIIIVIAHIYNKTNISFKSAPGFLKTVIQTGLGVPEDCTF